MCDKKSRMSRKLIESVISSVESDVCVRLSSCGYGCYEDLMSSLLSSEELLAPSSSESPEVLEQSSAGQIAIDVLAPSSSESPEVLERSKSAVVLLPWCRSVNESSCLALKKDSGLYTQCKKSRCESLSYCVSCIRSIERNGGLSVYGTVSDRMKSEIMEYKDPQGKSPILFTKIMKKLKLSRDVVELEAHRLNISIPECHFDETVEKRGRPKKEKSGEQKEKSGEQKEISLSSSSPDQEKKKRGRPKKEKEIISNNAGEDLIASLVQVHESSLSPKEEELEEEEEETSVIKFEINGTTYLKSDDHILYDLNTHEGIGIWNEDTKEIEIIPDDED